MMTDHYPLNWDLDVLYPEPSTAEFAAVFDAFRADVQKVAEDSDQLPPVSGAAEGVAVWVEFFQNFEDISSRAHELQSFIGCHCAADAENKCYQQFEASLSALTPYQQRMATNLEFALKDATDAEFEAFLAAAPQLADSAFFFGEARRHAALRLPKPQETLFADLSVDGLHAWGRLYDRISGELRVEVMHKGNVVRKSPGQIRLDAPLREVRENNFFAATKAWDSIAGSCADALNHIAGTRLTLYDHLGLEDHLVVPLHENRMQRETLDAMWSAIDARKEVLVTYLQKKAGALGLKKPAWYDLTAAYPTNVAAKDVTYDAAVQKIVETFTRFSPELGEFAELACAGGWIEAEDRGGKRQGGFCTGFERHKQSRIFMTFTNSEDALSTLAHELGHAYHSWVLKDQPVMLQDYPMNLAETASTFAEAIVAEQRLMGTDSRDEKIAILDSMLGDAVTFLMNIHARFQFENELHIQRKQGELSPEQLNNLMQSAQRQAYCDALADDGWNPNFWASKLHFYISELPFYNFPYTFGYLLSLGVYKLSQDSGGDFPQQYREFLIATGCMSAEDAVQSTFGYDLTQPDFWNKSLDVIEQRAEQFLDLIAVS